MFIEIQTYFTIDSNSRKGTIKEMSKLMFQSKKDSFLRYQKKDIHSWRAKKLKFGPFFLEVQKSVDLQNCVHILGH